MELEFSHNSTGHDWHDGEISVSRYPHVCLFFFSFGINTGQTSKKMCIARCASVQNVGNILATGCMVWNMFYFSIYWEQWSQLTNSYFSEGRLNHQPVYHEAYPGFTKLFSIGHFTMAGKSTERRVLLIVVVCYTSSYVHIDIFITSSHLHIFILSPSLSFSLLLSPSLSLSHPLPSVTVSLLLFSSLFRPRAVPTRRHEMTTFSHKMMFECAKLRVFFCEFGWSSWRVCV